MYTDFVVLAAGKGQRMLGNFPKVLEPLGGKPMVQHLIDRNNKLNVIFISSILSKINSPNRTIYSSFKNLQEIYLNKIARNNSDKLN